MKGGMAETYTGFLVPSARSRLVIWHAIIYLTRQNLGRGWYDEHATMVHDDCLMADSGAIEAQRAATATIRGYIYQFDASILAVLGATSDETVTVEGVEDCCASSRSTPGSVTASSTSRPKPPSLRIPIPTVAVTAAPVGTCSLS